MLCPLPHNPPGIACAQQSLLARGRPLAGAAYTGHAQMEMPLAGVASIKQGTDQFHPPPKARTSAGSTLR